MSFWGRLNEENEEKIAKRDELIKEMSLLLKDVIEHSVCADCGFEVPGWYTEKVRSVLKKAQGVSNEKDFFQKLLSV